jgi:four helix bundle protein
MKHAFYHHEKLDTWKLALDLAEDVYRSTSNFPVSQRNRLIDQMQRASISVLSNISEGASHNSTKQYIKYLEISRASASELAAQCALAKRLKFLSEPKYTSLRTLCHRVAAGLSGMIRFQRRKLQDID